MSGQHNIFIIILKLLGISLLVLVSRSNLNTLSCLNSFPPIVYFIKKTSFFRILFLISSKLIFKNLLSLSNSVYESFNKFSNLILIVRFVANNLRNSASRFPIDQAYFLFHFQIFINGPSSKSTSWFPNTIDKRDDTTSIFHNLFISAFFCLNFSLISAFSIRIFK